MTQLTISQALRRVKRAKGRVAELKTRAAQSVSYLAEQKPTFDFKATRVELAAAKEELIGLETSIACANAVNTVSFQGKDITLAEAIRRLQELKDDMSWLAHLTLRSGKERTREYEWDAQGERQVQVTRETVYASDMSEPERVKEMDNLRDRFESLNGLVESANHRVLVDWHAT